MTAYEDISRRGLCKPRSTLPLGLSHVFLLVNGRPPGKDKRTKIPVGQQFYDWLNC